MDSEDRRPANTRRKFDPLIARCRSWDDFTKQISALTPKEKGDAFERLTQLYLLSKPLYASRLRHVWLAREVKENVRRALRLPVGDEGIDLLAETKEGAYWALQCKFREDSERPLTKGELDSFVNQAFVHCRGISQAIVVHTCSRPVRKLGLLGNTIELGLEKWLSTTPEDWQLLHELLSGHSPRPAPRRPRPHQEAAVTAARKHFLEDREARGKLLMPCGTGKSLTAFWIAQELRPASILVAVPTLSLIAQSIEDWTREFVALNASPLPRWLLVCSDESTGRLEKDEFVNSVFESGIPATTDERRIREFLTGPGHAPKVVFTTYNSSPRVAAVARRAGFSFDLGILDEAHRTVGEKLKSFATLLSDRNIRIRRRLFMTATERVVRGPDDRVFSMDDEAVYGKRIFELTFRQAIHAKPPIISDYKILTLMVTDREVHALIRENRLLSARRPRLEEREAQTVAAAIALRRVFEQHGIKHAISFHRSIEAAATFASDQAEISRSSRQRPLVVAYHVSSKQSAGQRKQVMVDFARQPHAVLTNARCLTEGVDVPAIDCVLFADPKQSKIDIIQATGRALRVHSGKTHGYILLPIVVPEGLSFEEFIDSTEFRQVGRVIAALSTQDERIAEEFRVRDRRRGTEGGIVEFEGEIPAGLQIDFQDFAERVQTKLWERVGRVNWRSFSEARTWVRALALKSGAEWFQFTKSGKLPPDIPVAPNQVYRDAGWVSMGDWLGTGNVASQLRRYRPFKQARAWARNLGLKLTGQWRQFTRIGKLPPDIPVNPNQTYRKEGWLSFGDWLGTGNVASQLRRYRPFKQARAWARNLGLKSTRQWFRFTRSGKLPPDIPANPNQTYRKEGWLSFGDWLGTGRVYKVRRGRRSKPRPFPVAREWARNLKLKSETQWRQFTRSGELPPDIPTNPNQTYRNKGWVGWGDWLGTGTVAPRLRRYRPFKQARAWARGLNLKSGAEWFQFTKSGKLPPDIPVAPNQVYRDAGWVSMGDWLGTGNVASQLRRYRPFKQARAWARTQRCRTVKEWWALAKQKKRPPDIPAYPSRTYRDKGWASYSDWLGHRRAV